MLKIVLLVTGVAALLLSFIPSLRTEATPFLQHPDAIYLAILGLINLLFAPVLQSSHPTRPLQAGAAALLVLGVVLQALILLAPLPTIADQPAIVLPLLSLVLATALQLAGSLKPGKPVSHSASAPTALGGSQDSGNRETGTVKWFNTSRFRLHFPRFGRGHLRPLPSDSRRRPPHPHRRPARGVLGGTTGQGPAGGRRNRLPPLTAAKNRKPAERRVFCAFNNGEEALRLPPPRPPAPGRLPDA